MKTKTIPYSEYEDLIRCRNLLTAFEEMLGKAKGVLEQAPLLPYKKETISEGADFYSLLLKEPDKKKRLELMKRKSI